MRDAMGKKTRVNLFRLTFSTDRSSRQSHFFRLDPAVVELSRKELSGQRSLSIMGDSPIRASAETGRFRPTNTTVKIGLA